ncbi:MAG TPA: hypothetical protein PKM78_16320 [Anaerolineae bacterium]|nr:hypothetical protein [Anaerolineae bacterium]HNU05661.1 hypothetical protein [Anaerolineae bacterium]
MSKTPKIIDGVAVVLASTTKPVQPVSVGRRRTLVTVLSRTMQQIDRASESAAGVKLALRQLRQAVDPREVAGGFVGLTAGEVIGGAVGGAAGGVLGGPPGAVVGAEVGAFTVGMLGLKLGMDAVQDLKDANAAQPPADPVQPADSAEQTMGAKLSRNLSGRTGEIVGLTSGATIGLTVAGPAGGLIGAVVGETVGGRITQGLAQPASAEDAAPPRPDDKPTATQWLDRVGKNTAGEAATVLVAGSVGSMFGLSGLKVGQRIGRVVSKRIEWDQLGSRPAEEQPNESRGALAATCAPPLESTKTP